MAISLTFLIKLKRFHHHNGIQNEIKIYSLAAIIVKILTINLLRTAHASQHDENLGRENFVLGKRAHTHKFFSSILVHISVSCWTWSDKDERKFSSRFFHSRSFYSVSPTPPSPPLTLKVQCRENCHKTLVIVIFISPVGHSQCIHSDEIWWKNIYWWKKW
jgi:hypothetical protein